MSEPVDPRYVAARTALLDALVALRSHAHAVIVAGAQAVYLRTGAGDLAVAPYTTDSDVAVDPRHLGDDPLLETAMTGAGFVLDQRTGATEPGIWLREVEIDGVAAVVPVDLIVPSAVAPAKGRRAARLGTHGERAARKLHGLEAALVDYDLMEIAALDPSDARIVTAKVAGPAALLVAKAYKISERVALGRTHRLNDKDALDCLRIMQTTSGEAVGRTLARLTSDPVAGRATTAGLGHLEALFGRRGRPGIRMASEALRTVMPAERVSAICVAYTSALLAHAQPDRP